MGVRIDEAGGDDHAPGVDDPPGRAGIAAADGPDPVPRDRHVAGEGGRGAGVDRAASDQQVDRLGRGRGAECEEGEAGSQSASNPSPVLHGRGGAQAKLGR
jgi:hypothetical protein